MKNLDFASVKAVAVTGAAFLAAFHPGPYCLRTFNDRGRGPGCNYTVNRFGDIEAALQQANDARQGVFFVVNQGGHRDDTIARITAQFVEADEIPLAEQYQQLMAFSLPPSIIVRTKKSLHGYWLLNNDPGNAVSRFRQLQKALAARFKGDPVIANPSRVMRLPGFYHHKSEPLLVTCLKFDPNLRYSQNQLETALKATAKAPKPRPGDDQPSPPVSLNLAAILNDCAFMAHCRTQAAQLTEPLWFALITNLAEIPGGRQAIHELSRPYPDYSERATDDKINRIREKKLAPMSCEAIRGCGFDCPRRETCDRKRPRDLGIAPLAPWYQKHKGGLRLMPGVLARELIRKQAMLYVGAAFHEYRQGVYQPVADGYCKGLIREQLLDEHVRMHQINDVFGQWALGIIREPDQLNPRSHLLNVKNGLLNTRTGKLLPHDYRYPSTIQMQTAYRPEATAPLFEAFLKECLDPDTRRLVQEMAGYLLIPETCAQKAFVLVGAGGAGKSTLLSVIQELLLGRENVASVPWQSLGDRFKTAEIFGKLANIVADLPSRSIDDNGIFKSITGEDWLIAERKNCHPFTFRATARLVFSCNEIPRNLGDRSNAFYRRLVIIPFQPPKPEALRDLKLKEQFKGEAPGILNWALAGLLRLRENQFRFSESSGSREALAQYRIAGSSVLSFAAEHCRLEAGLSESAARLYHAYTVYARETGLKAMSQKRFWGELKEEHGALEKTRESITRRIVYRGIALAEEEGWENRAECQ